MRNIDPKEWELRCDLAAAYRLIARFGMDDLIFTHLSVRLPGPDHRFLLNPYGLLFDEITASSLVKMDTDGNVYSLEHLMNIALKSEDLEKVMNEWEAVLSGMPKPRSSRACSSERYVRPSTVLADDVRENDRKPLKEHQIKDKSFVYLFQLRHDGVKAQEDRYLGEFVVNGLPPDATDALVPLKPSVPLDAAGWDVLNNGVDQWIVYEHMPIDDHDVFSDLTEDEIRTRVPSAVAEEYVNDKKEPTDAVLSSEQLKQYVVEDKDTGRKVFLRPLRDYQQIFRNLSIQTAEMNDRLTVLRKEHDFATRAKVKADDLIKKLDDRKKMLDAEKALLDSELALVRTKREQLDAVLAEEEKNLATRISER